MPDTSVHPLSALPLDEAQLARLFKAIADNSHNIVGIKDLDGRYLYVNVEYPRLFHLPPEAFIGHCDTELFPPEYAARYRENDLLVQHSPHALTMEETSIVDGAVHHYLVVKFPILDDQGKVTATGLIATDITQRKQDEHRIWASEELFRLAFEHATVGMCLVDIRGRLLRVNPQFCQLFGYSREELEGMEVNAITHPDSLEASPKFIQQAIAGDINRAEFVKHYIHKQGHTICCHISSSLVRDNTGNPSYFISHLTDITENLRVEAELKRLANTDPLTGVANRRPFLEQMAQELARVRRFGTPASCLMLDFDHFKYINDRWGHSCGDAVLQHFSRHCQERLRATDLLGRLGGEEFGILMPGTTLSGAMELAEQLRQWINAHPLVTEITQINYSISMGVTALLASDQSADEVLSRTDAALYRAKDLGRNRVEAAA